MAFVLIAMLALPLVAAERKPDPKADEAAIRAVLADQAAAWNKGDLEGFMAGYWKSPDLTFVSGNAKTKGWDATLERYKKRYQAEGKEMGKLTFSELEVEQLGPDAALVRGRFTLEMMKEKPTGLFTLVLRRFPEGWRIVHDHTSG
jgi:beta-aspartyl-peptidase (threonine type)